MSAILDASVRRLMADELCERYGVHRERERDEKRGNHHEWKTRQEFRRRDRVKRLKRPGIRGDAESDGHDQIGEPKHVEHDRQSSSMWSGKLVGDAKGGCADQD